VALHIHERLSAQAILKLAQREPLQRSLFADPELEYRQAVQFYQHDVAWANRLILGDSLDVMHSLARWSIASKAEITNRRRLKNCARAPAGRGANSPRTSAVTAMPAILADLTANMQWPPQAGRSRHCAST
jgi:hypothetical protein